MSADIRQAEEDICIVLLRALYTGVELTDEHLRAMAKDFVQAAYRNPVSGMHIGAVSRHIVQVVRDGNIRHVTFQEPQAKK